ncbi:MAG: MFS transporter [Bdellovibrio sp.]|nr:MAG: MFS transporter [Bdellovibrio sp.]
MPSSIWALGLVSLFMDLSSETIHSLLPTFLVTTMGASLSTLGSLEGLAEATALIAKIFSGPLSDRIGRRKPLVVLGYSIGALSKPLFALAGGLPLILGARLIDRCGKGIREAPRDALIADLTPPAWRGRAFGLRQTLDNCGAVLGPLAALLLMALTNGNFRFVFFCAAIPAGLAVGTLVWGVQGDCGGAEGAASGGEAREGTDLGVPKASSRTPASISWRGFGSAFWFISFAGALFQLARFSEAFLIVRANDLGLSSVQSPLVLVAMNVVYSFLAYPVGKLSDHWPRQWFLWGGLVVLGIADLLLSLATGLPLVFLAILLWGFHLALTQGTLAAMVADTCPVERRGTAYGLFNLVSAAALFVASAQAGVLWDYGGARLTFSVGAVLSFMSLIVFLIWEARRV